MIIIKLNAEYSTHNLCDSLRFTTMWYAIKRGTLFQNLWLSSSLILCLFHFLSSCSTLLELRCGTNCGTVPQFLQQWHSFCTCSTFLVLFYVFWSCSTLYWFSWILPNTDRSTTNIDYRAGIFTLWFVLVLSLRSTSSITGS